MIYHSPRWHLAVASGFLQYSLNIPTGRSGTTLIARSPSSPRGSSLPSSSTIASVCPGAAGPMEPGFHAVVRKVPATRTDSVCPYPS